jgi:putative endonuclease
MAGDRRGSLGSLGERLAGEYLERHGCRVIERNFRTTRGEIDLIAATPRAIVFCEVKTRVAASSSRGPPTPLDGIGPRKRTRLRRLANEWLRERPAGVDRPGRPDLRFDAIGVVVSRTGALLALEHVENAF